MLAIEIDLTIVQSDEWLGAMAMLERLRQRDPEAVQRFYDGLKSGRALVEHDIGEQLRTVPFPATRQVSVRIRPSEALVRFLVAQERPQDTTEPTGDR